MNVDDLRSYFLPKAAAPAPTMEPIQPGVGIPTSALDAAMPAPADDPNEIQMYGDERDLVPSLTPEEIEMPAEYVGRGRDPSLAPQSSGPVLSPSQVTPPAPGVIPSTGGPANQASGAEPSSEVPVTPSQAPLSAQFRHAPEGSPVVREEDPSAPSDPTQTATWGRGVEDRASEEDRRIQEQANARSVESAERIAAIASRQLAEQLTAQKAVDDRVAAVQKAQDAARTELTHRSDVLARAAEQRLAQRPGASTRAAGRAMLAIAAGMGSQAAANLYEARLNDEERNERNDIERRNSDIAALAQSHGAGLNDFNALMASAMGEQSLASARQLAREKLGLKELETELTKLAPGDKQLQGQALLNEQRRKHADNVIKLANEQVKQQAQWMQLHPVVVGKVPGAPPAPPERPIRKQDESDEAFNQRYSHWQSAEMPYYESVALPQWKARLGAAGTATRKGTGAHPGSPMSQWESGQAAANEPVTGPAQTQRTGSPRVSGKTQKASSPPKGAGGTASMLQAAKDYFLRGAPAPGKSATKTSGAPTLEAVGAADASALSPAEVENIRLRSIPLPGTDIVIPPKRGAMPLTTDEEG